jgi:hypothetical protein
MASIHLRDPIKLLRISPLILSTVTLTFAGCEAHFYSVFLHDNHRAKSNTLLPSWWKVNFGRMIPYFLATYALNIILSITNLLTRSHDFAASGAKPWYVLGTMGAVAHFLFARLDFYYARDITEGGAKGKSVESMKNWLSMHTIRMLVADIPGWVGNFLGVLATISM